MKIRTRTIYSLLLVALTVTIFGPPAAAERPPFKVFTTEEGLAHDSINKIVRDSRGFLWFCTAEGLSRFDGARFTNFTQDQGLPHRNVSDLLETRDGTLLVATSAGISIFDPRGKAYRWQVIESRLEMTSDEPPLFRTFAPATDDRQKLTVQSLAEDGSGTIWAIVADALFRIGRSGDELTFEAVPPALLNGESIQKLFVDSQGRLLIGSTASVLQAEPNGTFSRILDRGTGEIMEDRDGNYWLDSSTAQIGLQVFSRGVDGKLKPARTYTKKDGLPADAFFFAIKQTSDGRIFVGMHDGLCEFLPAASESEAKFRLLGHEKVTSLGVDTGGGLWVGTQLFGAWKLAPNDFSVFGEADGFRPTDEIMGIGFDPDGNIFIPARPNSTLYFEDGKFRPITPLGLEKRSWSWHLLDLLSKDGEWWIPSVDGLRRYPRVAKIVDLTRTPPKKIYSKTTGLPGNEIFNLFEDSRGDIWFTVIGVENSLCRWDRRSDTIVLTGPADGLPKFNGPLSFAEDKSGAVWMGYYFGGLARYKEGKYEVFGERDGLPQTQVADLLVDGTGRLWIGTAGRGLFVVNDTAAERPTFSSISTLNGLSSNQVICLTHDSGGRIYAGTGRGINRIDDRGKIAIYTQADGLPSNYITRCSADNKGYLWFLSRNTLVRFFPEAERPSLSTPVFIDKILVNGVPQRISVLGESKVELQQLGSDQRQMEINFFALTFGSGSGVRYQYRLDDQTDWGEPSDQQNINLNLSSGDHVFYVRALTSDNTTSEVPATVTFRILPPVYARWWFIMLSVLVVAGLLFSFYRYRTSKLREVNIALEDARLAEERLRHSREERLNELEKVRSRIATDLHDDIGASLTQIAVLSEVAQTKARSGGSVDEPLIRITDVSNELVGTMSDIVWSINPAKDHLGDLLQRMRRFAADVLASSSIRLHFQANDNIADTVVNSTLRREVFLIFKESINNVAKHSEARNVWADLNIVAGNLKLTIRDDGRGFEPEGPGLDEKGNGLASMRRRTREMGGVFDVRSTTGGPTTILVSFPIENAAN